MLYTLTCWQIRDGTGGFRKNNCKGLFSSLKSPNLACRQLENSAMMSTSTVHCRWEDETVMEKTGHPPACAKAKKMNLLALLSLAASVLTYKTKL